MLIINNQEDLAWVCSEIAKERVVSLDTEFMRRVTYYAKLGIIQMVTPNHRCIIDVVAMADLTPLADILFNDEILKIIHAPREDFEILYRIFKRVPQNIFDTQIAADLCNIGASASYVDLCRNILQTEVDKSYQTADWLKRPLTEEMLNYAIKDVDYLYPLYKHLNDQIHAKGLQEEFQRLLSTLRNPQNYVVNLNNIWKKVSLKKRSRELVNKMQILAAFREECAMQADLPRKHFASDDDLHKICTYLPTSEAELRQLNLASKNLRHHHYKNKLFELCTALRLEDE